MGPRCSSTESNAAGHRLLVPDVAGRRPRPAPAAGRLDGGDAGGPVVLVPAEDADRGPQAGELGGDGLPQAGSAAGDDDDAAGIGSRRQGRGAGGRGRSQAGRCHGWGAYRGRAVPSRAHRGAVHRRRKTETGRAICVPGGARCGNVHLRRTGGLGVRSAVTADPSRERNVSMRHDRQTFVRRAAFALPVLVIGTVTAWGVAPAGAAPSGAPVPLPLARPHVTATQTWSTTIAAPAGGVTESSPNLAEPPRPGRPSWSGTSRDTSTPTSCPTGPRSPGGRSTPVRRSARRRRWPPCRDRRSTRSSSGWATSRIRTRAATRPSRPRDGASGSSRRPTRPPTPTPTTA